MHIVKECEGAKNMKVIVAVEEDDQITTITVIDEYQNQVLQAILMRKWIYAYRELDKLMKLLSEVPQTKSGLKDALVAMFEMEDGHDI
jgi:hypothetical protein